MLTFQNPLLEELIKNSYVLKKKLSPKQREIFLDKALQLPTEGQQQLIKKLQAEEAERNSGNTEEALTKISQYKRWTDERVKEFREYTFRSAEKEEKENIDEELEKELQTL